MITSASVDVRISLPVGFSKITNVTVTIDKDAIVIPETGKLDVPMIPVIRAAEMANRKEGMKIGTNDTIIIKVPDAIKNAYTASHMMPAINKTPVMPLPSVS
jgi:hypothetical protein